MAVGYGLIGSGNMGLVYAEALATQVTDGELRAIAGGSARRDAGGGVRCAGRALGRGAARS